MFMNCKKTGKKNKLSGSSFDTSGTEGMLDVVLGCTLIFILLTSLIQAEKGSSQEITLPDIDLSKTTQTKAGASSTKKSVISLKMENGSPVIFLDDKQVTEKELKSQLGGMKGIGHIALRRDKNMPCKWEDQIILHCREAGVDRVAIMVQAAN